MDNKICSICNENKNIDEYYVREKTSAKGEKYLYIPPYCKVCWIDKSKIRMYENYDKHLVSVKKYDSSDVGVEKHRERQRRYIKSGKQKQWQRNHPEKIKNYNDDRSKKNHIISNEEWKACKRYFDNTCAYCGMTEEEHRVLNRNHDLHKEHVDDEGSVYLDNCVPSCVFCNTKKSGKDLYQWYNEGNKDYQQERLEKILKWLSNDYKQFFEGYRERRKYKIKVSI